MGVRGTISSAKTVSSAQDLTSAALEKFRIHLANLQQTRIAGRNHTIRISPQHYESKQPMIPTFFDYPQLSKYIITLLKPALTFLTRVVIDTNNVNMTLSSKFFLQNEFFIAQSGQYNQFQMALFFQALTNIRLHYTISIAEYQIHESISLIDIIAFQDGFNVDVKRTVKSSRDLGNLHKLAHWFSAYNLLHSYHIMRQVIKKHLMIKLSLHSSDQTTSALGQFIASLGVIDYPNDALSSPKPVSFLRQTCNLVAATGGTNLTADTENDYQLLAIAKAIASDYIISNDGDFFYYSNLFNHTWEPTLLLPDTISIGPVQSSLQLFPSTSCSKCSSTLLGLNQLLSKPDTLQYIIEDIPFASMQYLTCATSPYFSSFSNQDPITITVEFNKLSILLSPPQLFPGSPHIHVTMNAIKPTQLHKLLYPPIPSIISIPQCILPYISFNLGNDFSTNNTNPFENCVWNPSSQNLFDCLSLNITQPWKQFSPIQFPFVVRDFKKSLSEAKPSSHTLLFRYFVYKMLFQQKTLHANDPTFCIDASIPLLQHTSSLRLRNPRAITPQQELDIFFQKSTAHQLITTLRPDWAWSTNFQSAGDSLSVNRVTLLPFSLPHATYTSANFTRFSHILNSFNDFHHSFYHGLLSLLFDKNIGHPSSSPFSKLKNTHPALNHMFQNKPSEQEQNLSQSVQIQIQNDAMHNIYQFIWDTSLTPLLLDLYNTAQCPYQNEINTSDLTSEFNNMSLSNTPTTLSLITHTSQTNLADLLNHFIQTPIPIPIPQLIQIPSPQPAQRQQVKKNKIETKSVAPQNETQVVVNHLQLLSFLLILMQQPVFHNKIAFLSHYVHYLPIPLQNVFYFQASQFLQTVHNTPSWSLQSITSTCSAIPFPVVVQNSQIPEFEKKTTKKSLASPSSPPPPPVLPSSAIENTFWKHLIAPGDVIKIHPIFRARITGSIHYGIPQPTPAEAFISLPSTTRASSLTTQPKFSTTIPTLSQSPITSPSHITTRMVLFPTCQKMFDTRLSAVQEMQSTQFAPYYASQNARDQYPFYFDFDTSFYGVRSVLLMPQYIAPFNTIHEIPITPMSFHQGYSDTRTESQLNDVSSIQTCKYISLTAQYSSIDPLSLVNLQYPTQTYMNIEYATFSDQVDVISKYLYSKRYIMRNITLSRFEAALKTQLISIATEFFPNIDLNINSLLLSAGELNCEKMVSTKNALMITSDHYFHLLMCRVNQMIEDISTSHTSLTLLRKLQNGKRDFMAQQLPTMLHQQTAPHFIPTHFIHLLFHYVKEFSSWMISSTKLVETKSSFEHCAQIKLSTANNFNVVNDITPFSASIFRIILDLQYSISSLLTPLVAPQSALHPPQLTAFFPSFSTTNASLFSTLQQLFIFQLRTPPSPQIAHLVDIFYDIYSTLQNIYLATVDPYYRTITSEVYQHQQLLHRIPLIQTNTPLTHSKHITHSLDYSLTSQFYHSHSIFTYPLACLSFTFSQTQNRPFQLLNRWVSIRSMFLHTMYSVIEQNALGEIHPIIHRQSPQQALLFRLQHDSSYREELTTNNNEKLTLIQKDISKIQPESFTSTLSNLFFVESTNNAQSDQNKASYRYLELFSDTFLLAIIMKTVLANIYNSFQPISTSDVLSVGFSSLSSLSSLSSYKFEPSMLLQLPWMEVSCPFHITNSSPQPQTDCLFCSLHSHYIDIYSYCTPQVSSIPRSTTKICCDFDINSLYIFPSSTQPGRPTLLTDSPFQHPTIDPLLVQSFFEYLEQQNVSKPTKSTCFEFDLQTQSTLSTFSTFNSFLLQTHSAQLTWDSAFGGVFLHSDLSTLLNDNYLNIQLLDHLSTIDFTPPVTSSYQRLQSTPSAINTITITMQDIFHLIAHIFFQLRCTLPTQSNFVQTQYTTPIFTTHMNNTMYQSPALHNALIKALELPESLSISSPTLSNYFSIAAKEYRLNLLKYTPSTTENRSIVGKNGLFDPGVTACVETRLQYPLLTKSLLAEVYQLPTETISPLDEYTHLFVPITDAILDRPMMGLFQPPAIPIPISSQAHETSYMLDIQSTPPTVLPIHVSTCAASMSKPYQPLEKNYHYVGQPFISSPPTFASGSQHAQQQPQNIQTIFNSDAYVRTYLHNFIQRLIDSTSTRTPSTYLFSSFSTESTPLKNTLVHLECHTCSSPIFSGPIFNALDHIQHMTDNLLLESTNASTFSKRY